MGRYIRTKNFRVLTLKMNKLWPFKKFYLWGWGQNRGWGQNLGQILIRNGYIYYHKKFRVLALKMTKLWLLKKYLWGWGQNGGCMRSKSRSDLKGQWVDLLPKRNYCPIFKSDWVIAFLKSWPLNEDEVKMEAEVKVEVRSRK